jgi:predicted dehydrogenase
VIRIAFLGCDSTHTEAFANLINFPGAPYYGLARVVSIWGEDSSQLISKAKSLRIDRVASSPQEALENVDLAMVIGRFGDSHFAPAMAAIKARIPTFVDKPFTVSSAEARLLSDKAYENNVPLLSASPLRFSKEVVDLKRFIGSGELVDSVVVSVPATCTDLGLDLRLNSAFFYGIHGLEMLLELTGHNVKDVSVNYGAEIISAQIEFGNGLSALLQLVRNVPEFYEVKIYSKSGEQHQNIALDGSYYKHELSSILKDFMTGQPVVPIKSTLTAIEILERIDRDDPYKLT